MSPSIRPFELASFEDEARALVQDAQAQAREILRSAAQERDRLLDESRRQGYETGRAEGRAEGAAEARLQAEAWREEWRALLERLAVAVEDARRDLIARAERELVQLAVAIAEKIVKAEIRGGRPVAAANLRRAIELLARRRSLRVLLHPEDLGQVEAALPDVRRDFAEIASIELEPSESVGRGGCVVATPEGSVDADVETQLDEIERGLLGES